jgi:hypothetical protein
MRFDLLIRGGEVVDPGGGRGGRLDVAINGDRIAAVDRAIPAEAAFRVIDADGQYVTPASSTCTRTSSTRSRTGASTRIRSGRPPGRRPGTRPLEVRPPEPPAP